MPSFSDAGLEIRPIETHDIPAFMEMLGELADFFGGHENYVTSSDELHRALFSAPPTVEAIIGLVEGEVAGFVNFYEDYKIFSGRRAMRVDYLYVRPQFRNHPLAFAMLAFVLRVAKGRGYRYLEGEVLDRNLPARKLYEALKATPNESRVYSLDLQTVDWSLFGSTRK